VLAFFVRDPRFPHASGLGSGRGPEPPPPPPATSGQGVESPCLAVVQTAGSSFLRSLARVPGDAWEGRTATPCLYLGVVFRPIRRPGRQRGCEAAALLIRVLDAPQRLNLAWRSTWRFTLNSRVPPPLEVPSACLSPLDRLV